ncbi:MAG: M14 family metallocarboxypeptidase [Proteobacteria bacterium]|nr:M14 family metallocarboxypeptidase [Pseudomonadota bacterium]
MQCSPSRRLGVWLFSAVVFGGCASQPPRPRPLPAPLPPATAPAPVQRPVPLPAPALVAPPAAVAPAPEPPAVAARFPDPPVSFQTPAFGPGHTGYTSNEELQDFLRRLVHDGGPGPDATTVRLLEPGTSQRGVPIEALLFTRDPDAAMALPVRPTRPTVLLIGQQHGDEPAGSEALLAVALELAHGRLARVLDKLNVVILPRANPDGAAAGTRSSASGIDINRDQLLLRTPEAQAQAQLLRQYTPLVVVDAHEYPAVGRFVEKFRAAPSSDVLLQYATTANLPEFLTKAAEEWFRRPLLAQLKTAGLSADWYYTATPDLNDGKLAMGGPEPDSSRNVNGLRNAVSFLIETRGGGLGRAYFKRRVYAQVTALGNLLESAAARSADLVKLRQFDDSEVASKACQGDVVLQANPTASEYRVTMLDRVTGADKAVTVAWDSTLELETRKSRARPCGYWLAASETEAVTHLRGLGIQVQRVEEVGVVRGESYREVARELVPPSDPTTGVTDAGGVVKVGVEVVPTLIDVPIGSYYVGLDQPLANLAVAALEPDTNHSYVAHRVVTATQAEARLMARPEMRMTALP